MGFQFYDREDNFAGGLETPLASIAVLRLSEAGAVSVSAPYASWLGHIPADFRLYRMELTAPGVELPQGRWLTCNHEALHPGVMTAQGNGLLEELRQGELPANWFASYRPVLEVMGVILAASGTDWVLGEVSTASNSYVSVNLEQRTYLGAIVELCEMTGNYFRHDGHSRSLDILTEASEDLAAMLSCADHDLTIMPTGHGGAEDVVGRIDASEILRGVYPEGADYVQEDSTSRPLRPLGTELLPVGFGFEYVGGALAVVNHNVSSGLLRSTAFAAVEALSNLEVSVQGSLEAASPGGVILSEALNRPNDDFWKGGTLEVSGMNFTITGHVGARIYGGWGALEVSTPFTASKSFEYDLDKLNEARQTLVDAAVGRLLASATPAFQVTLSVRGLDTQLLPGDRVRLECVGHILFEDALTMYRQLYTFDDFNDEYVVIAVTAEVAPEGVIYQLELSDRLQLLPTEDGVRELYSLMRQKQYARTKVFAWVGSTEPTAPWAGMLWVDDTEE